MGDRFSYSYSVSCDPAGKDASFEYTNSNSGSLGGTFKMQSISSVRCISSLSSTARAGDADIVTFTGFGTWSKDAQPHLATVQVANAPTYSYVHILIDGGSTSQANTKPPNEVDSLPKTGEENPEDPDRP